MTTNTMYIPCMSLENHKVHLTYTSAIATQVIRLFTIHYSLFSFSIWIMSLPLSIKLFQKAHQNVISTIDTLL